jgi:enamine deaminase RidA (YjgF/YER057c/UK114 family)
MTSLTHIPVPDGVAAANGYSHVVIGTGRFVAIAGQIALDENGELVGPGDPVAQAKHVFDNLDRCLAAAGATFDDVVKLTFFVTDVGILPAVREARDAVIDTSKPPASTAVQVASLAQPEFLLEVEAYAVLPSDAR